MKILSLDSTADVGTVALCEDDRLLAEMTVNTGNTHSESLLPTVESVLKIINLLISIALIYYEYIIFSNLIQQI